MSQAQYSPRVPRYSLVAEDDGRVRLAEGRSHDGPILEGRLVNLSVTGAMIEIRETTARTRFLDEGEMIKIEIAIPEAGRFAFFATVVRLEPSPADDLWQLGIAFRNLPSVLAKTLDRYVTTRSKDYSHPQNYDFAVHRGFKHAAGRILLNRLAALRDQTTRSPLWWLALIAFVIASMMPTLVRLFSDGQ